MENKVNNAEELLRELKALEEEKIKAEEETYTEEAKASKWYERPTLEDAVGDEIAGYFRAIRVAIERENKEELFKCIDLLENAARNFGRGWYDEDTGHLRTGYKAETTWCVELRNLVAKALEVQLVSVSDYYEGVGC